MLLSAKELHGINPADEQFLIVIEDLIGILRDNKIPEVDHTKEIKCFNDAVKAHDYEKLLEYWPKHHGEAPSGDEEMKDPIKTKIATKVKNVTGMKGLHFTVSKDVKYETKKYNKAFKVTEKKLVKTAKK